MLPLVLAIVLSADDGQTLDLPAPTDPVEFRNSVESADAHLAALSDSISGALEVVPDLGRFMRKVAEADSYDWEKNERELHDRFPAAYLIWPYKGYRFQGFETDERALKSKLTEASERLAEQRECTRALLKGDAAPSSCKGLLTCSYDVGSDASGLFRYVVEKDYEAKQVRISRPEEVLFDSGMRGDGTTDNFTRLKQHLAGLLYDQCRLIWLLRPNREPKSATLEWKHFTTVDTDEVSFRDVCTRAADEHPLYSPLKALATRFPKAKSIQEALEAVPQYCNAGAVRWCGSIEGVGDSWILTYFDGCTQKRASASDLRNSASTLKSEAARAPLLARAATVDTCVAARKVGYEWKYYAPPSPEQCRKPPTSSGKAISSARSPPLPKSEEKPATPDDRKPARADQLKRSNPRVTWSNFGWTDLRWGMGPADVDRQLRDPDGRFRFDGKTDCTISDSFGPNDLSCWVDADFHSFRLIELAPIISMSFIELELWNVTLHFPRSMDLAASMQDFRTLREQLEKKYGKPWYERVPPRGPEDFWRGNLEWQTPTLRVELDLMTFGAEEASMTLRYSDPIRVDRLNARGAAKRAASKSSK